MNERVTEGIVREKLNTSKAAMLDEGYHVDIYEQIPRDRRIKACLASASKKGTGKSGRPEFIVVFRERPNFVIVIECKSDMSKHESSNGTSEPAKYSVDGVRHYAQYLSQKFDVLAIAVSGIDSNRLRISHFWRFLGEEEDQQCFGAELLSLKDYFSGYSNLDRVLNQDLEILKKYFLGLNDRLRVLKIQASERSLLISAIMMALQEGSFRNSYKLQPTPKALITQIKQSLNTFMDQGNTSIELRECMDKNYMFLDVQQKLLQDRVLFNLVSEVDEKVDSFEKTQQYHDLLGQMYVEFLKYSNNDAGLGIVLTPPHITEISVDFLDVHPKDRIYDNCAGTGGFLVAALKRMFERARGDQMLEQEIRRSIFGVEIQPNIATLLWANMFIHGDGKNNMIFGDCFDDAVIEQVKQKTPTVGLLNPPFSTKDRHEIEFVLNNLSALTPKARCAAILPMNCVLNEQGNKHLRDELLEKHTLEAVISLPDEVFVDSKVNTVVCLIILTAHVPHPNGKKTWFGYCKEDGFIKQKPFGRIDADRVWPTIRNHWLTSYKNRESQNNFSIMREVSARDEWCAEAYLDSDYTDLGKQCVTELKLYVLHRVSRLINLGKVNIPELSVSPTENISLPHVDSASWGTFLLGDLFTITGSQTTPKKKLEKIGRGNYPYVTCRATDNATSGWYDYWTEEGGIIVVDSAVVGHASYQPYCFSASDHVEKLLPKFQMSPLSALFFVSVQNMNKFRYSYGRKASQERLRQQPISLPIDNNGDIDYLLIESFMKSLPYSEGVE